MELAPGAKIGPYEILSRLGVGGMGEVWKACDTRLDRTVAIKVSKERFSDRFNREARAVAALNHQNVCQLYDVGPDYLVMEYVEGEPITPVDTTRKLLDLAVQMSEGLAAAHAAGIVHRDLKPDNILIKSDGRIKILDFGLAKAAAEEIAPGDPTLTIDHALTDPGTTVGTIAYMSPEQARGATNLTAQSDQFSLGLVLYELATGKRAFQRGSAVETMTAIIREDAEPLPANFPAPLRWIIARLLAKGPTERYDSTQDLYRDLRQLREGLSETTSASVIPAVSVGRKRRLLPAMGLVGAGLALGAVAAALLIRPDAPDLSAYKFTPLSRDEAMDGSPAWSPDGKSIAYTANVHGVSQVFTKALGAPDAAQLTHSADGCMRPFWSRDGAAVYYNCKGNLWAVGASGGTPELVMEKVTTPALHPDGKTLVFERDGKIWVGLLKGGTPRELSSAPRGAGLMQFSPDGSRLFVQTLAPLELWILPWPSGTPRNLGAVGVGMSWLPDSRHLLVTEVAYGVADRFSLLDTSDGSRRVIYRATYPLLGPSVSPDGKRIAYGGGAYEWNVLEISVPEGRVHTLVSGAGASMEPDWAPSGTHYLYATFGAGNSRAIEDRPAAEGGFSRRVVESPQGSDDFEAMLPKWSPDGTRFLFVQGPWARFQLTIANASGGRWTPLAEVPFAAAAWSPDGQWIAFVRTEGGKPQLVKMKPVAGATAIPLANAGPSAVKWSRAGDWIAYTSAEGISMISPDGNTVRKLTARKLLSFDFTKDGAQVYGIVRNTLGEGAQWQLYSIDVKTGADKMLAPIDLPASTDGIAGFSLHPDGKRFLTSIGKWPYDIWMLEGWDQPPRKTWLDRLLRR